MKYRVVESPNGVGYHPEYFSQRDGWKAVYTEKPYDVMYYNTLEEAQEACKIHAMNQPKVVWTDEL